MSKDYRLEVLRLAADIEDVPLSFSRKSPEYSYLFDTCIQLENEGYIIGRPYTETKKGGNSGYILQNIRPKGRDYKQKLEAEQTPAKLKKWGEVLIWLLIGAGLTKLFDWLFLP